MQLWSSRFRRSMPIGLLTAAIALVLIAAVTFPMREGLYRAISSPTEQAGLVPLADIVGKWGLLLLVALTGVIVIATWLWSRPVFWQVVASGVGVVLAYGASELLKSAADETRPCHSLHVVGDLLCADKTTPSWPSNHSTIAAAFAVACIIALPRLAWVLVPLTALIAFSRVASGVHYVHDVASGLALGTLVVGVVVLAAQPLLAKIPHKRSRGRHA